MKSVVVCASKRYKDEVAAFCRTLEELGVTVFEPDIANPQAEDETFENNHIKKCVFTGLTLKHFDWIRKADTCFIYNRDGYVGKSVTLEMGFATALGKPLYALTELTGDPCTDILIDKITATPQALAKLLS